MARRIFVLLVFALFIYVASPLVTPIAMGGVLAVLLAPALVWTEKRRIPPALGSLILTLATTLVFLLPTALLAFFVVKSGLKQLQGLRAAAASGQPGQGWVDSLLGWGPVHRVLEWVTGNVPVEMARLVEGAEDVIGTTALKLGELFAGVMSKLPGLVMALLIVIVSIYFFLLDGRRLLAFFRKHSFFPPAQTEQFMQSMGGVCRSVILASVVAGAAQSVTEIVACLIAGVPDAFMIGGLVFIASFIPLIGAFPVTLFVALQQFYLGNNGAGVGLLIAAGLVSTLDNFIRPLFLQGSANLHPLLAFVAALGGLQTIGVLGVFLGPVIAAMFIATIQLAVDRDGAPS